jgi:hypothetical protein
MKPKKQNSDLDQLLSQYQQDEAKYAQVLAGLLYGI